MIHDLVSLVGGFGIALTPLNLFCCFVGVFLGTLVGVLPGIGPPSAMAMLLPVTFGLSPVTAMIMLSGIYYGSMYGGSTTSILVNIPGEPSSVMTCLDGYQMAQQGRAGPALGIAAFGSFIAGTFGLIGLMFIANPLAEFAIKFGPAEYFALVCLGLVILSYLTQGSILRGLAIACLGLFLSLAGQDVMTGGVRFNFGLRQLQDGYRLVPVIMGLFGISEVLLNLEAIEERIVFKAKIRNLLPSREDWRKCAMPVTRGTIIGFFMGIIPGVGSTMSTFFSYAVEKKFSKHPETFGRGAIEGVASPESANNSASSAGFIPLFSLGIPGGVTTAILLGALMIHGMQPGPLLVSKHPEVFWGTVASMYVGNVMLLVLNLPLIGLWVQILKVPYRTLFPLILFFCLLGAYAENMETFDVYIMVIFGILGYVCRKFNYEVAPLVLAYVLGPMLEKNLRLALVLSDGSPAIFLKSPISVVALSIAALLLLSSILPSIRKGRATVIQEE
jgi:putative tricarboxylic transport membrane protein